MSENQGTTQNNTPGVTPREFDISIWQDILHIVEHLYDELSGDRLFRKRGERVL